MGPISARHGGASKRKYESDDEKKKPKKHGDDGPGPQEDEDDSGDSEGEGGDEMIYDASDEPFPIHAAFDPALKTACQMASKVVDGTQGQLRKHAPKCPNLQNMQKNAAETLAPPRSEPPTIAMVGNTGEGKSRSGNGILGVQGLMRTGSAGQSVTNVATVFQWSFPEQKKKHAAKISYRALEDCRAILEDLLACYKQSSLEADEESSKEQKSEYEMHAQEAIKTLVSLFVNNAGFRNHMEASNTLEKQIGSDGALLIEKMLVWCKAHFRTLHQVNGACTAYFEADEYSELDKIISPYTTDVGKAGQPSWWPLVREVRIGTNESRFLEYVRVGDLPGQSDTNPIRARTAEENIQNSQGLWIFADIKRAITDPALHRSISLYAERFPDTIAVVLTKTDLGIDDGLLQDMRAQGEDMTEYDRLTEEIPLLRSELNRVSKKMFKAGRKSAQEIMGLSQQLRDLGKEETDAMNKQFGELVMARNNYTKRRLQEDKQQYFPKGKKLRVFTISPEHYEVHTASKRRRVPLMDVTVTGLPELREHALMMAGPPLWKAQTEYLESQVSVFVHGLKLWSTGCAVEDRTQLLSIVEGMKSAADTGFDGVGARRDTIMEKDLFRPLRAYREKARANALLELKRLDKWNARSWISFYRHFGRHTTDSMGAVSWNEMFLQSQTQDMLDPRWHEMLPALQATFAGARDQVVATIDKTKKTLMLSPATVSLDKAIIEGLFKGILSGVQSDYDRITELSRQGTLAIKLDATKDRGQSFFTQAMDPGYKVGQEDTGHGVSKRCRAHLRSHLSLSPSDEKEPFAIHHQKLSTALKEDSRKHTKHLQNSISARTTEVYRQFETITEQKPETPAEVATRKAVHPFLKKALEDIAQIQRLLDDIRRKYPQC